MSDGPDDYFVVAAEAAEMKERAHQAEAEVERLQEQLSVCQQGNNALQRALDINRAHINALREALEIAQDVCNEFGEEGSPNWEGASQQVVAIAGLIKGALAQSPEQSLAELIEKHCGDVIAERDAAEEAVQWLDQQAGGDGEYKASTVDPKSPATPRLMCEAIARRWAEFKNEVLEEAASHIENFNPQDAEAIRALKGVR